MWERMGIREEMGLVGRNVNLGENRELQEKQRIMWEEILMRAT